jgi:hypothetical protein
MQRFIHDICQAWNIVIMKKYITLSALLFVFFSCTRERVVSDFGENIKIKIVESVDSTKKTLTLKCFTEKIFNCSNYYLLHTVNVSTNKITINFTGISDPTICLTSLGPASAFIDLINLAHKDYELEINMGDTKFTGQLKVSAANYSVTMPVQNSVQFLNPSLNRLPPNTIWGTVHFHIAATNPVVQGFIDSLQILGAVPASYTPGEYSGFEIESNGQIKQVQDLGYYFTRYYIFNYSGNSLPLKGLVRRYGINNPASLLVTLNTTKGETFMSWVP